MVRIVVSGDPRGVRWAMAAETLLPCGSPLTNELLATRR